MYPNWPRLSREALVEVELNEASESRDRSNELESEVDYEKMLNSSFTKYFFYHCRIEWFPLTILIALASSNFGHLGRSESYSWSIHFFGFALSLLN